MRRVEAVGDPVVEPGGAELLVEAQRRFVPVQGGPLEADVAALEGEGARCSITARPMPPRRCSGRT